MNQDVIISEIKNPLISMSYHIDFSDFLSLQEALKSFCELIEYLKNYDKSHYTDDETEHIASITNVLDKLSERILSFLQSAQSIHNDDKTQLTQALQTSNTLLTKMLGKKKNFQHLRFMLMTTFDDKHKDTFLSPMQSSPLEVFDILLKTPDEMLVKRDVHLYKTKFVDKQSHEASRLHHIHNFFNHLRQNDVSEFKREFIIEWIFEGTLINALLNEDLIYMSITILKDVVRNFGHDVTFMHGLLRALQKDYTILEKSGVDSLEQATSLVETIFPLLVTLAKENLPYVTKQIIGFTFDLPTQKEEYRLIKWHQWRWIRMLATHTWDASLREPPSWVVSAGSTYCAVMFDCAPSVWLQNYAYLLIERIYGETLVDGFIPTLQHYDYVEFLVRSLKQKSPYFASHGDAYLCLHLLSRLTPREASKEAVMDLDGITESNPISQALGVLMRMTRI